MLTDKCNGSCVWCIEKDGYRPPEHVGWERLVDAILLSRRRNIILLGGEPTLYEDINKLIASLAFRRNIYITTNGSKLTRDYVKKNLNGVQGVNVSIHSISPRLNKEITGIQLEAHDIGGAIEQLHEQGASVRFNCNLIKGYVDSKKAIIEYITWVKAMGGDSVRFAELKADKDNFVDLAKIMDYEHGLNDDPFTFGCHQNAIIEGLPVNFRQMCGLQTENRVKPKDAVQPYDKSVLYYDGHIYQGWTKDRRFNMNSNDLENILISVSNGELTPKEAMTRIYTQKDDSDGAGCRY
jgi:organic radical activating enzyme